MDREYTYTPAQCDVNDKSKLQAFRDKRRLWLSWIDRDEHHAIWTTLSAMVWREVSFKTLSKLATGNGDSALHNTILAEQLFDGHVANQVLAIRRLVDDGSGGIISLRKLFKDIKRNFELFTRENYVCFDGLPYDYAAVEYRTMVEHAGKGAFWGDTTGPLAHGTSRMAHEQFDRLAGISPASRRRDDRLPASILTTLEQWFDESGADDLAKWSHNYLAHAGGPESRGRIAELSITAQKIAHAIRMLARVTEALSAYVLFASGRSSALMPTAQFDVFEKLDQPVMQSDTEDNARASWDVLSTECDQYLDGVVEELVQGPGHAKQNTPLG